MGASKSWNFDLEFVKIYDKIFCSNLRLVGNMANKKVKKYTEKMKWVKDGR